MQYQVHDTTIRVRTYVCEVALEKTWMHLLAVTFLISLIDEHHFSAKFLLAPSPSGVQLLLLLLLSLYVFLPLA